MTSCLSAGLAYSNYNILLLSKPLIEMPTHKNESQITESPPNFLLNNINLLQNPHNAESDRVIFRPNSLIYLIVGDY